VALRLVLLRLRAVNGVSQEESAVNRPAAFVSRALSVKLTPNSRTSGRRVIQEQGGAARPLLLPPVSTEMKQKMEQKINRS
jgi:hypothetical protein